MGVSAEFDGNSPTLVVSATSASGVSQRFILDIVELSEVDSSGSVVRTVDLTSTTFVKTPETQSNYKRWTFTATLKDGSKLGIIFTQAISSRKRATMDDGDQVPNTIKIETSLSGWSLKSPSNALALTTETTAIDYTIQDCSVDKSVYSNNLEWLVLTVNGIALYYQPPAYGSLDTNTRSISNGITKGASVQTNVPFFWYNASIAHMLGFYQDPYFVGCALPKVEPTKEKKKWEVYLSIPLVIVFIVVVLIVVMFFMRRRWYNRRVKPDIHPMVPVSSEMVILPPPSPPQVTDSSSPLSPEQTNFHHSNSYHTLHPQGTMHSQGTMHYDPRISYNPHNPHHTLNAHSSVQ